VQTPPPPPPLAAPPRAPPLLGADPIRLASKVFEEAGMGTAEAPAMSRVRGGKASAGTPADEEDDTASVASSKAGGSRGRPKKEEEEEEEEAPSRANRSRRQVSFFV
jgi:hypothetical protein